MAVKKSIWLVAALVAGGAAASLKSDSIRWRLEQLRGFVLDLSGPTGDTLPAPGAGGADVRAGDAAPPATIVSSFEQSAATAPAEEAAPEHDPSAAASPTAAPTPVPLATPPRSVTLAGTRWEKQGINNCGPATLSVYLSYYGWQGTQKDIAAVLHPNVRDKNVRWDELVYYVKTRAGWLDALFRVGGTTERMKHFIANGYPVAIETGYELDVGWVGHYLLLTGYDDEQGYFIVQDVTGGPDRKVSYEVIDKYWQQFNRLYIVVFRPERKDAIEALLGPDADEDLNRQRALEAAQADVRDQPDNAFAWFNLGSNLNYFDRYDEAAEAFDRAREIGLPKRMLFYQFGPYRAYFNVGRFDDVIELSTYTLDYRPDLEESYFWRAWAQYMLGQRTAAVVDFRRALEVNPTFNDAKVALETIGASP